MVKRHFGYETSNKSIYQILKDNAERMRKFPTEAERLLWERLKSNQLGVKFRRQHPVADYIPDFICLQYHLIVEIDGGYHLEGEQPGRDAERARQLEKEGYTIVRFTNDQVINNIDNVVEKIKKAMEEQVGDSIQQFKKTGKDPQVNLSSPSLWEGRGRLIIFSAPSGSGKSTIVSYLMKEHPELNLAFSISATTRAPRGTEKNGVEYIFLSVDEFKEKIKNNEFLEHEEVYPGRFYGTLKSQVDTQTARGENVVFDVDVKGGCNIKKFYGDRALSIFIQAPSIEELRKRLEGRGTDSEADIQKRLEKASYEMTFAPKFDHVVVNDDLQKAEEETYKLVSEFLKPTPALPKE